MKKASCITLPTIGPMSRNRAHTMPSSIEAAKELSATRNRPTGSSTIPGPGATPKIAITTAISGRLCAAISRLRTVARSPCTECGSGTWRITASALVSATQASLMTWAIRFHTIRLTASQGR